MSEDIFEHMMDKYGFIQEIIDNLVNIPSQDLDSHISFLIERIEKYQDGIMFVYFLICDICEIEINHIREYWQIFDQIYQHFKIHPETCTNRFILLVLLAKKYNLSIKSIRGPNTYPTDKSFDEILNFYESNPIMHCIIHDDIRYFKDIIDSYTHFDFDQIIFDKSLIENCCFCGAVECFKLLRSSNVKITKQCLDYSIDGRAKFIINECMQYFKPDESTMKEIIRLHDFDMAISFEHLYEIKIPIARCLDIRFFSYLLSKATNYDELFRYCLNFQNEDIFDDVFNLGVNIDNKNAMGENSLFIAVRIDDVAAIAKLVKLGANLETKNNRGETPLFVAAFFDRIKSIEKLVELGANLEATIARGETPLFVATYQNNIQSIAKLIELGANIDAAIDCKETSLFVAAGLSHIEALAKLVELGANIEAKDETGATPLFAATMKNKVEAIEKLIELGANKEATDYAQETALFSAASFNHIEAITKLVELGLKIEAKNSRGETPIFKAAEEGCIEAIEKLIELGANIEATDVDGNTPLILAARENNIEVIEKLVELGADTEVTNNDGATALIVADEADNPEAMYKLIELGANFEVSENYEEEDN